MESKKDLWKGIFIYNFQTCKEFAWAYSEKQAKTLMCKRLAKKQGVSPAIVFKYFDGTKNNYRIQIEIEMED